MPHIILLTEYDKDGHVLHHKGYNSHTKAVKAATVIIDEKVKTYHDLKVATDIVAQAFEHEPVFVRVFNKFTGWAGETVVVEELEIVDVD